MKTTEKQLVDGLEKIHHKFDDIVDKSIKEIEKLSKIKEEIEGKIDAPNYEKQFKKKHGKFRLFFVKKKLYRYIKREEKYFKLSKKYRELHTSLSLAVASGFDGVKEHQKYLKSLSQRTEKIR